MWPNGDLSEKAAGGVQWVMRLRLVGLIALLGGACHSTAGSTFDAGVQSDTGPASEGGASPVDGAADAADVGAPDLGLTRAQAATAVAAQEPLCANLGAFYWEIGDASGALASGTGGQGTPPLATDALAIASASKLLFGVYMMERNAGALTADEIKFLTFHSGVTNFSSCGVLQSVAECLAAAGQNGGSNGDVVAATVDHFFYSGGHMQALANLVGLGADHNLALASDLKTVLGADLAFSYLQPQLAGGGRTSAVDYALFLRRVLDGTYAHALAMLGTHAVCTHPGPDCPSAIYSPVNQSSVPIPPATTPNDLGDEKWHYSLGHWVEDDPDQGDGAFSSPGAFGFYPWIDSQRRFYGILARADLVNAGSNDLTKISSIASVRCGRLIRKAWLGGR